MNFWFASWFDNTGMNRFASRSASHPPASPARIILATLNAKYIHASLGLRYLLAHMDAHGGAGLRAQTQLREFVIGQPPTRIVEVLLALKPEVIGLGVYIWNVVEITQVVRLLKTLRPDIKIVLGGPEVSHELAQQEIFRLADHVITGWGDVSFPRLCRALLDGPKPLMKAIAGEQPALSELALPYTDYSDEDLARRLLYVEASRGCPFKCEFCLEFAMVYDPQTPYTILQNSTVDFAAMQRIKRFARYWEMVANSGRFALSLNLLLKDGPDTSGSAFGHFLDFSDWLWQTTGKTHEFALEKLVDLLFEHLTRVRALHAQDVRAALLADYRASGARARPHCLAGLLGGAHKLPPPEKRLTERQSRHLSQQQHLREDIRQAAA